MKIRKNALPVRLLTTFALLITAEFAVAQETTQEATAAPAMWRVADADSEFILLGTFHILPPALQWRTPALDAAITDAEKVYFEVDADAPGSQSTVLGIVMTEGFLPAGETLSNILDDDDTARLKSVAKSISLPFAGIDPMRPWNAFLTLTVQFIVDQGFDPAAGVDSVLLSETRTLGKDLIFFESLQEQLEFFTGLSSETEKQLLEVTLRDWDEQSEAFDDLYRAWAQGDVDLMDQQMNDAMRDQAPEVYDRLIVERNLAWAERLEADLKAGSGKALVAVGAGHLVGGADSLPELLKERGFEVERYGVIENAVSAETESEAITQDGAALEDSAMANEETGKSLSAQSGDTDNNPDNSDSIDASFDDEIKPSDESE